MLVDDLTIAVRDRAREPELPAATIEHALHAALPERFARYALVMLPPKTPESATTARALAVEFARHEHPVFWLEPEGEAGPAKLTGSHPPLLKAIPAPAGCVSDAALLTAALADLRASHGVDAAAIHRPDDGYDAVATTARLAWGWRSVLDVDASSSRGEAADVRIAMRPVPESAPADLSLGELPSWPARWSALDRAIRETWPRASVIVVTYDNLAYNRLCLASLLANTEHPNTELIFVDNGSTDGSVEFLAEAAVRYPNVRLVRNSENRGFGPANNQGIAAASGDTLVLLNNDTIVTPGWLSRLTHHLEDEAIGLIGPATNRTCNEAQVELAYQTYGEMTAIARQLANRYAGDRRSIRMLAMFCTAFRRDLVDTIGNLDERYELGMFEDEDYALRAKAAGYDIVWTPEVYIHHAYHASIGKLLPTGQYLSTFRANQQRFEAKWGICWERHRPPAG
ncbi:MAG: glycosyltransferase family 2 protein [Thermomicrobiales bacterium]|nr:glycosyltransferase family 2 protein [Thermomicrobiales bacterium]